MPYEIDFIGVGKKEAEKDASAICFRWTDACGVFRVGVYDGGFKPHGEEMCRILDHYYFDDPNGEKPADEKVIDFVAVSHSDSDHVNGLKVILESFTVKAIYMNRPWLYASELIGNATDGRTTISSLERRLRAAYAPIAEIEEMAQEKGIEINDAFRGAKIAERFWVLSPTRGFYLGLIKESQKTPVEAAALYESVMHADFRKAREHIRRLRESWTIERLRDETTTTPENEMSVVLLGILDENVLLTGDAGVRALNAACDYAERWGYEINKSVKLLQVPHHGGRHNVTPAVLDRLVGEIVPEGTSPHMTCFVPVAEDSDHPLQMVVNAFTRRGAKVYKTDGGTINHHCGDVPDREGWSTIKRLNLEPFVEEYDD